MTFGAFGETVLVFGHLGFAVKSETYEPRRLPW